MTHHYKREIYYHIFIMCYVPLFCHLRISISSMYVCGAPVYILNVCVWTLGSWAVPERQCSHPGSLRTALPGRWQAPWQRGGRSAEQSCPRAFVDPLPRLLNRNSFAMKVSPVLFLCVAGERHWNPELLEFHRKPHLIALLCLWDLSLREGSQIIWNNLLH